MIIHLDSAIAKDSLEDGSGEDANACQDDCQAGCDTQIKNKN